MDHVRTISSLFWGQTAFFTLFIISMLFLFFFRKKWKKAYETYFWHIILLYVLLLANPFTLKLFLESYFPGDAELVRLYILLPVGFVIANVLTEIASEMNGRKKVLVLMIFIAVLAFSGKGIMETGYYIKPQSIYKVNDDGREAADIMQNDVKKDIEKGLVQADRYNSKGEYISAGSPVYLEAQGPDLYDTTRLVMTEYSNGYDIKGKFERGGSYFFGIMCYADWRYIQASASFISSDEYTTMGYDSAWLKDYYLPKFAEYTYITFEDGDGNMSKGIEDTGLYHEIGKTSGGYVIFKKTKTIDTSK